MGGGAQMLGNEILEKMQLSVTTKSKQQIQFSLHFHSHLLQSSGSLHALSLNLPSPYLGLCPLLVRNIFVLFFCHLNSTHSSSPFSNGTHLVTFFFLHPDVFSQKLFSFVSHGNIYIINIVFIIQKAVAC